MKKIYLPSPGNTNAANVTDVTKHKRHLGLKFKLLPKIRQRFRADVIGDTFLFNICVGKFSHLWQNITKHPIKSGLEIRVVPWPQSTKSSVGPPDSARWWSGGLLGNSP